MIRNPLFSTLLAMFALALTVPAQAVAQDEANEAADAADAAVDAAEVAEVEAMMLSEEILDRYVGKYELAPGFVIDVTREGQQLYIQATNQQRFEAYADSETTFFLTVVDAQIEFNGDGEGPAESMTLYQGGQVVPGPRVE